MYLNIPMSLHNEKKISSKKLPPFLSQHLQYIYKYTKFNLRGATGKFSFLLGEKIVRLSLSNLSLFYPLSIIYISRNNAKTNCF